MDLTKVVDRFEQDTVNHELEVLIEDGVNRILRFKDKSGSSINHFYVMQTQGKICYTGDMGDYVFTNHNKDMLAWFHNNMSLSYIAEKCRTGSIYEYCKDLALESIKHEVSSFCESYIDEYVGDDDVDMDAALDKWTEDLANEVLSEIDFENEFTVHTSAYSVSTQVTNYLKFEIDTSDGINCNEYTYRYLWCVLAMNKVAELYFKSVSEANNESA